MALPALLLDPMTCVRDWNPGDPLYTPPDRPHPRRERLDSRLREDSTWSMTWTADRAVPGPWRWLCGDAATGGVTR